VSARYERGSIILTSNKSYGDWGSIFGDSIIATAILDRLLHHSTTINIRGESYRLKDRRKAGLVPGRGQDGTATSLASDSVTPKTRQKTALGSTASEAKEAHQMKLRSGEFSTGAMGTFQPELTDSPNY
jgi:hypothetical protein